MSSVLKRWELIYSNAYDLPLVVQFGIRFNSSIPELRISWFNHDHSFICRFSDFYSALIAVSCGLPLASEITVEAFNLFDCSPQTVKCYLSIYTTEKGNCLNMSLNGDVHIRVSSVNIQELIPILQKKLNP